MEASPHSNIPAGWKGGFAESNPAFSYDNPGGPDLSSLPMLDNMDNIDLLQREQGVEWPEFSWEVEKGQPDPKRCFQMFAPYISRIGYTDKGRVYSIICPQQGTWLKDAICLNVEVTVTGQRGWVNETTRELAADMTVEGKVWFTPGKFQGKALRRLWGFLELINRDLPLSKGKAVRVATHLPGNPGESIFPLMKGETAAFKSPDFAKHPEAWAVGNLQVEIGGIHQTGDDLVDEFNTLVMEAFNLGSGNMLQTGNILTWNVWFREPDLVKTEEWRTHAERWRTSIDEHHGSPHGEGATARFFDGTPFSPLKELEEEAIQKIIKGFENIIKHALKHRK